MYIYIYIYNIYIYIYIGGRPIFGVGAYNIISATKI